MIIATTHELIKNRELLFMITWRDIRIKYKQSIMGFLWAVLMPGLIVATGILVRIVISKLSGVPLNIQQISSVSVKSIPWAFFISSIRFGTNSLIGNGNLVSKIYFPREIFPISAVLSQLFDFFVASCVLIILLTVAGTGLSIYLLWVLPLLLDLILLLIALVLMLSAANLFLRDVKYLVEVITSFAIFFTPVFYDAELAGKYKWILFLNPVAPILEGLNSSIILHSSPDISWVFYSTIISVLGTYFSLRFFKNLEPKFAESL
jgi:lipopolysaccharide transport system permease protein